MPYHLPDGADENTTAVQLAVDQPRQFTLTPGFHYRPATSLGPRLDPLLAAIDQRPAGRTDGPWVAVPRWQTDLASIPGVLWGLIASYGRHTLAVLLHDYLCDWADTQKPVPLDRPGTPFERRCVADEVFYQALRDQSISPYANPWFRSLVLWTGVSIGRYWAFRKGLLVLILLAAVFGAVPWIWVGQHVDMGNNWLLAVILLVGGLLVLTLAGWLAHRLEKNDAIGPQNTRQRSVQSYVETPAPTRSRLSPAELGIALLAAAGLLSMVTAVGATGRWPGAGPLSDWLTVTWLVLLIGCSVVLRLTSPIPRDALLPLITGLALPTVGLVALVTYLVLQALWVPDAFDPRQPGGPVNPCPATNEMPGTPLPEPRRP
jgi:hypothetical protein